ncbi:MAG TPA: ABC transporter permease [Chloroflexota bacterium]|nr:ABC transporter permease [Chloroflexota bacterium]
MLLLSLPLLLFLLVPLVVLVLSALPARVFADLRDPTVSQALSLSLVTTLLSTTITVIGGTPVAYLLARRRFAGRAVLDTLIDLPMVLPPAVAGIALLIAFGRRGFIGQYLDAVGIEVAFTEVAVVLAQIFVAGPLYVKSAIAGFSHVDQELERVAGLDGANSFQVFQSITLPLARTALISGAVMTWARALGEFGATIIFAGNFPGRTQTMPLAIYIGFEIRLDLAVTLAIILLAISFGVLFIVKGILRRGVAEN